MRIQRSYAVSRRAISLLGSCLIALCWTTNAQDDEHITTKDVGGAGVPALLKACDTNQDGIASASELNAALLNWFQQADPDSSGALSETEFAAALKSLFPAPQPPPGVPPPPEEMALHDLLAKRLIVTVDSNKDGWMTFQEALSFVSQAFPQWDADRNSSLNASEFAAAFAQLMPAPPFTRNFGAREDPSLNVGFDY
jgi:EF hand